MLRILCELIRIVRRFDSVEIAEPVTGVAPKVEAGMAQAGMTQPNGSSAGLSFDLLLFGATGDLALRKLVPALYRRHLAGQIGAGARIVGVARTAQTREVYIAQIEETCRKYLEPQELTPERWKSFTAILDYVTVDATQAQDFQKL